MIDLAREDHKVIISRTFSKIHEMAGLRVGYGFARSDIVAHRASFARRSTFSGWLLRRPATRIRNSRASAANETPKRRRSFTRCSTS
ncbi:MAG TPA: aminotransferase class I/II-fold pyridoxal phosphate-dependent enzyme [Blastocatellia bacterium]|nr:aminotransferase class I/II-fold pyridoxal phosphate-dependent enzyme [Blastocatellia bacterium]